MDFCQHEASATNGVAFFRCDFVQPNNGLLISLVTKDMLAFLDVLESSNTDLTVVTVRFKRFWPVKKRLEHSTRTLLRFAFLRLRIPAD